MYKIIFSYAIEGKAFHSVPGQDIRMKDSEVSLCDPRTQYVADCPCVFVSCGYCGSVRVISISVFCFKVRVCGIGFLYLLQASTEKGLGAVTASVFSFPRVGSHTTSWESK